MVSEGMDLRENPSAFWWEVAARADVPSLSFLSQVFSCGDLVALLGVTVLFALWVKNAAFISSPCFSVWWKLITGSDPVAPQLERGVGEMRE